MEKVSIIITCYNKANFIEEALDSAIKQTYKNIEIVVVNDASTDESDAVIKQYINNHKFNKIKYYVNATNKGVIFSRNFGIDKATGDYILPLDADDVIDKTYVEKASIILLNHPDIGVVYCKARKIGDETGYWNLPPFNPTTMLFINCVFNCALFRKKDFILVGKYKYYMKNGLEDWDLWLSFIENGFLFKQIDEILFSYRIKDVHNRSKAFSNNCFEVFSNLGLNHSKLYFSNKEFITQVFFNIGNNKNLENSRSYKIGRIITSPFRVLKKVIKR